MTARARSLSPLSFHILAALLAVVLSSPAQGAEAKYGAEFLKIGVGARALGMGGAFVALADDASAPFWNPAGLVSVQTGELLFMHSEHFGSLANHDYFGFVQPLEGDSRSAVGVGLIRFSIDEILVTRDAFDDLNGSGEWEPGEPIRTDQFRSDSDDEYGLLLSYARDMADLWSLGGNVKLLRQGLLDNTSFGMGLDLGVLFHPRPNLDLGLRVSDVTQTQVSWDTGHRESISPTVALGLKYTQPMPGLKGSLTAAGDFNQTLDGRDAASQAGGGDFQGGLEYWHDDVVAARVGSDAGDFTAGAGLRIRSLLGGLGVDYAFLAHDVFDDTHRVSASVRF